MQETWKDIAGYEGIYQVSSHGRVKSMCRKQEVILKPFRNSGGYLLVQLNSKSKKPKKERVHRLVAKAFIKNPFGLPCVNHKDENIENNSVENLEWCTYSYNNTYGNHIKNIIDKTGRPVVQMTNTGDFIARFHNMAYAQRQTGIDYRNISKCCTGRLKTAHGYKWKYA